MKFALLPLALLLLSAGLTHAELPPPLTAQAYLLQPEKWLEKSVTLAVAYVTLPSSTATIKPGFRQMKAMTFNSHTSGGELTLLVAPSAVTHLVQICGTKEAISSLTTQPHIIQGIFSKVGDRFVLIVEK